MALTQARHLATVLPRNGCARANKYAMQVTPHTCSGSIVVVRTTRCATGVGATPTRILPARPPCALCQLHHRHVAAIPHAVAFETGANGSTRPPYAARYGRTIGSLLPRVPQLTYLETMTPNPWDGADIQLGGVSQQACPG